MEPLTLAASAKLAAASIAKKSAELFANRLAFSALANVDPEAAQSLAISMSAMKGLSSMTLGISGPAFNGIAGVERIADIQVGPTCWREALENLVQIMEGDKVGELNCISDDIYRRISENPKKYDAVFEPMPDGGGLWSVPRYVYPAILKEYGIDAKIIPFSHSVLQKALAEHRPVVLSGLTSGIPEKYGDIQDHGAHALVAIDYNPISKEYTLLDSNYDKPYAVSAESMDRFMKGGRQMCVTKLPAENWSVKTAYIGNSKVTFGVGEKASIKTLSSEAGGASLPRKGGKISFGASLSALQTSAELSRISEGIGNSTIPGRILKGIADAISGTNKPGMEIIQDAVKDAATFYKLHPPKVCFEEGQPGMMWEGRSEKAYDDWVGGDPNALAHYASIYGGDFAKATIGHEIGHHVFAKLGFNKANLPLICNEAVADYLSGLYCGAKKLDGRGFSEFLAADTSYLGGNYPKGSVRSALFKEGYATSYSYAWRDFESVLNDPKFNLKEKVAEIALRNLPQGYLAINESGKPMRRFGLTASKARSFSFRGNDTEELNALLKESEMLGGECRMLVKKYGGVEAKIERRLGKIQEFRQSLEREMQKIMKADDSEAAKLKRDISWRKIKMEGEENIAQIKKDISEFQGQRIKKQTEFQYKAEEEGYKQMFPRTLPYNWGDPNLFSKGNDVYRQNPQNGEMTKLVF